MIPALVRLPVTRVDHVSLDALARCVDLVAEGRTVLVGAQRSPSDDALDEFVVATALSRRCAAAAIGVAAQVGAARKASIAAREATTTQLLGACDVLLLDGEPDACRDGALVIEALFTEGVHTVTTPTAIVVGARNLPLPDVPGGPPVCWREGAALWRLVAGEPVVAGTVVEVRADAPLPDPAPGVLVVLDHPLGGPDALASALAR